MPLFILSSIILIPILGQLVRIDLRQHRLPDRYTLPLICVGLATNALAQRALPTEAIWGAIIGYVVFWLIGAVYFRSRGQEGLGLGDAKLLSAAGAWAERRERLRCTTWKERSLSQGAEENEVCDCEHNCLTSPRFIVRRATRRTGHGRRAPPPARCGFRR